MPEPGVITLLRSDNRIVISPTTPKIEALILPQLRYTSKKMLYGWEAKKAGTKVLLTDYDCFVHDLKDRIATSIGFLPRIRHT